MTQPASVPADGNVKVVYVPALANPAAPTVTEATGASAKELSCYLTADGWNPSTDEQVVVDDRLCSRQTFEGRGRYTDSLEVGYVHNPKSPANNEAYLTLTEGVGGYLLARWGDDYETALAANDIVDVIPITAGVQRKQPPEANSVLKAMQKMFIPGKVNRDVLIVA